ncbi:hypothetical protein ACFWIA_33675 [Streptomyces sp. NPDC127068]|uniref:hypothetical protein n=1 Tax=Streptomyces sp. NPDC127068 TaxID=3347127 RepID=UPI003662AB88
MEPIGKNPSLVDAAAIDPAHVPGLATPVAVPKPGVVDRTESGPDPDPESDPESDPEPESDADSRAEADGDSSGEEPAAGTEASDGPVFEVSDRRGSIVVDETGVRFTLDDQAAEWTWDEIGALEITTGRFPRRLTLYVHTPDRRWYPNEIRASSRAELTRWSEELDAALDAWFDDADADDAAGAEDRPEGEPSDAAAAADTTDSADAADEADTADAADAKESAKPGKPGKPGAAGKSRKGD